MKRILLLEDDLSLIDGLSFALQKQGWEVKAVRTITEARKVRRDSTFDLLILDVTLPDGNGFDFCKSIRTASDVPILFLTALDEEISIVQGLDLGGDDYVTKPFKLGILLSRVNALLRRSGSKTDNNPVLESNGITVSMMQGQAYKNGESLELTGLEYRLFCLFMQNSNRILTKDQIYAKLWDCDGNFVEENTLSVYIRRLRLKLEDNPEQPEKIVTVRGLGYKWSVKA